MKPWGLRQGKNAREEFLKLYVAFKLDTNFVDVVPQASGLRLSLNCKFEDIHDPKGLCRDVTNLGRWGNGDVELKISQVSELPYAVELIQQVIDIIAINDITLGLIIFLIKVDMFRES